MYYELHTNFIIQSVFENYIWNLNHILMNNALDTFGACALNWLYLHSKPPLIILMVVYSSAANPHTIKQTTHFANINIWFSASVFSCVDYCINLNFITPVLKIYISCEELPWVAVEILIHCLINPIWLYLNSFSSYNGTGAPASLNHFLGSCCLSALLGCI